MTTKSQPNNPSLLRNIVNAVIERNTGGRGLSNHEPAFQIAAHGASELANVIVHGQPAPIYGHFASPPDLANAQTPDQTPSPNPQQGLGQDSTHKTDIDPSSPSGSKFWQVQKMIADLPNLRFEMAEVSHAEPIAPGHTPGHAMHGKNQIGHHQTASTAQDIEMDMKNVSFSEPITPSPTPTVNNQKQQEISR